MLVYEDNKDFDTIEYSDEDARAILGALKSAASTVGVDAPIYISVLRNNLRLRSRFKDTKGWDIKSIVDWLERHLYVFPDDRKPVIYLSDCVQGLTRAIEEMDQKILATKIHAKGKTPVSEREAIGQIVRHHVIPILQNAEVPFPELGPDEMVWFQSFVQYFVTLYKQANWSPKKDT